MKVTCYGPRGSIPAPSTKRFSTIEFGGDTTCYYVEAGPFVLILDCGSGMRALGNDLMSDGKGFGKTFICPVSHYHWDHIQGLPFFVPVFIEANTFHFHGFQPSGTEHGPMPVVEKMLEHQQSNPHFPVAHGAMPSKKTYTDHARQFSETFWYTDNTGLVKYHSEDPSEWHQDENVLKITTIPLNHPNGCLGYRIEYMGQVLVYATDNEPLRHPNFALTKHGKDADILILDGQYTEKQLCGMVQTFGHGTPKACVEQAIACKAKYLVIHHHDPNNDDDTISKMEHDTVAYANALAFEGYVEFARQDAVWEIG